VCLCNWEYWTAQLLETGLGNAETVASSNLNALRKFFDRHFYILREPSIPEPAYISSLFGDIETTIVWTVDPRMLPSNGPSVTVTPQTQTSPTPNNSQQATVPTSSTEGSIGDKAQESQQFSELLHSRRTKTSSKQPRAHLKPDQSYPLDDTSNSPPNDTEDSTTLKL